VTCTPPNPGLQRTGPWTRLSTARVASLVILAACQATPRGLSDQDRQANQAITDASVRDILARDFDGLAALYANDGIFMPPNRPAVAGRNAIRQWNATLPPVAGFRATNDEIDGGGDIAYVRGRYAVRFAIEGIPADSGKYLEVRRRQSDGSWKITIDMFNSNGRVPDPQTSARTKAP
jgi:ketosteroid isomerase-like protein